MLLNITGIPYAWYELIHFEYHSDKGYVIWFKCRHCQERGTAVSRINARSAKNSATSRMRKHCRTWHREYWLTTYKPAGTGMIAAVTAAAKDGKGLFSCQCDQIARRYRSTERLRNT